MFIYNTDDTIDLSDVADRIEKLRSQQNEDHEATKQELECLEKIQNEARQYNSDWDGGETLIRHTYFEDYARELAEDCGLLDADTKWPIYCIDWEFAARELRYDYAEIDFDGVAYYIRIC
jgi:hypothetical protein